MCQFDFIVFVCSNQLAFRRRYCDAGQCHENLTFHRWRNSSRFVWYNEFTSKISASRVSCQFLYFLVVSFCTKSNKKMLTFNRMVFWIRLCNTGKYQLVAEFDRGRSWESNDAGESSKVHVNRVLFFFLYSIELSNFRYFILMFWITFFKWQCVHRDDILRWRFWSEPIQGSTLLHLIYFTLARSFTFRILRNCSPPLPHHPPSHRPFSSFNLFLLHAFLYAWCFRFSCSLPLSNCVSCPRVSSL